ncbi:hypothetical protein SETIT_1G335700v2 [Setaria italica]|uniref:Uncharacterized protein n=2 Tax=Setaria TaxID=4554 RepID=A0A368PSR9_SETIT|nr:hypothetical protein SETIT_1G335700v2 [Setaria italica]TKW41817.1 hypothetical protein SEVIR_1G342300v2 [Setaria viridis]
MTTQEGAGSKKPLCTTLRCTFAGGDDERGGFTGEQLRYPCKLRRHICAKCGMHRGEHDKPYAGVSDDLLPPRKRSTFRRLGEFQVLQGLGSGCEEEEKEAAPPLDEGPSCWSGSAITKGKRGPRRKRADLLCCELSSLND